MKPLEVMEALLSTHCIADIKMSNANKESPLYNLHRLLVRTMQYLKNLTYLMQNLSNHLTQVRIRLFFVHFCHFCHILDVLDSTRFKLTQSRTYSPSFIRRFFAIRYQVFYQFLADFFSIFCQFFANF